MIGVAVGTVVATRGGLIEALLPAARIGTGARIVLSDGRRLLARVTALAAGRALLAPFGTLDGLGVGDRVEADMTVLDTCLGTALLGRAIDGVGRPLDGGPQPRGRNGSPAGRRSDPLDRARPRLPFTTGVRAIDGPLAFATGARIGIFGAPGCGKSTLLETVVAHSGADVAVIGLIGERGREAQRWLSRIDGRTTLVCATGDRSPAERLRAAELAFAQAETLRRRGLHVLLVIDSLARVAAAARDIAVAAGEPVGRAGYPPSVFGVITDLLERAGAFSTGSITLIATVLADGPASADPVSDACRAALDGHIVLSERLARQGWFPAIDLPASTSRTFDDVASPEQAAAARALRWATATLEETREARGFGLDPGAGDPAVRRAIAAHDAIAAFFCQDRPSDHGHTLTKLLALTDRLTDGYPR
jgi:flagellum-specific ATP synthase